MQDTPFSQTTIGYIILGIIVSLAAYALQRAFDGGAPPIPSSIGGPGIDTARAQQEALKAKAEAEAASLRAKEIRDGLILQQQLQDNQRRMREAAEAERVAAAQRARAYRQENHGCALGTHLHCLTANDSRTGAVLSQLGCSCEPDS
ncbi:MAG: hypothetical protein ACREC0_12530 [Methylocella sp.]